MLASQASRRQWRHEAPGCGRSHKTGNVLNKLPKSLQAKAKGHLQEIWMAETRKKAETAFDFFEAAYGAKYDKAVACLTKDRDVLLTFYDFPAEHWKHLRTLRSSARSAWPDREHLRHGPLAHYQDQRLPQPHNGHDHGLQALPISQ